MLFRSRHWEGSEVADAGVGHLALQLIADGGEGFEGEDAEEVGRGGEEAVVVIMG